MDRCWCTAVLLANGLGQHARVQGEGMRGGRQFAGVRWMRRPAQVSEALCVLQELHLLVDARARADGEPRGRAEQARPPDGLS